VANTRTLGDGPHSLCSGKRSAQTHARPGMQAFKDELGILAGSCELCNGGLACCSRDVLPGGVQRALKYWGQAAGVRALLSGECESGASSNLGD